MTRSFRVSKAKLQQIKNVFNTKGWTQEYLAGAVGCSRQVVINFFARRPVEKRFFQGICTELDSEWGEMMEPEEEQSVVLKM